MICHCSNCKDYKWDLEGANFFCTDCQQIHRMCCVVKEELLCGEVDGHEGPHVSVSQKVKWGHSVSGSTGSF